MAVAADISALTDELIAAIAGVPDKAYNIITLRMG